MSTISKILESKGFAPADIDEVVHYGPENSGGLDQQVRSEFNITEPIHLWEEYDLGEADEDELNEKAQAQGYEDYHELLNKMDRRLLQLVEELPDVDVYYLHYHRRRIGERIKSLREEKGMTQQDLASACGLQRQNIARIEHSRYSVGQDILSKIATALGKTLDIV